MLKWERYLLFCIASDKKLGRAWERGCISTVLPICLPPTSATDILSLVSCLTLPTSPFSLRMSHNGCPNLFLWTYQIYIEVGCRNCCLSDHQLVYRIWKEQTDSKKTNSEERQYTEHTVSAIRSFCKRTYTRYPGTSLKSLMTLRIDGSCRSYFSTWFWMSMNMPPYKSPGKGKINQVPWFTDEIRELVKERNHLWLNLHFPCVNFTSLPL